MICFRRWFELWRTTWRTVTPWESPTTPPSAVLPMLPILKSRQWWVSESCYHRQTYLDLWRGTPFSLAWLVYQRNLSERRLAQLIGSGFKKGCVLLCYTCTLVPNLRVLLLFNETGETGSELSGCTVQTLPSGSFLFWGGAVCIRETLLTPPPPLRRTLWTICVWYHWYVPPRRRSPNFQPSRGPVYL